MNENILEFLKGSDTATVTFCQGRYVTRIKKLAEKYPDECEIVAENPDGSILAHIPVKWIKISANKSKMTDAQRAEASERLKTWQNVMRNDPKNGFGGSEDS